jgi:hypothetical protein
MKRGLLKQGLHGSNQRALNVKLKSEKKRNKLTTLATGAMKEVAK